MRKVVFLDIDGVIMLYGQSGAAPSTSSMRALERIVEETKCDVVLSSTWRWAYGLERMAEFFAEWGLAVTLHSATPTLNTKIGSGIIWDGQSRGTEIAEWIRRNTFEPIAFVILDDCDDMDDLMPRLILTHPYRGLTDADATKAIQLLSQELGVTGETK